jgi:UDP-4-amino-4,6-dideoxy-N-acetyl-beta-L-altrosamine transaminase
MIPYGRQDIDQDDINSVIEVLKSNFLTQGPVAENFENKVCEYVSARYAVSANSATSALHIACLSLNLGVGDWLWTSPITFVASANCALYCGANIDFVDICETTFTMCPVALEEKLIRAKEENCLPKIVIPVHVCGQSADMKAIKNLSKQYGFHIIEDASHAIGGKYIGERVGCCRYSDITVFSFHPVKIITTGEGGIAVTNRPELAERMRLFRSHGITRDQKLMEAVTDGPWSYQQIALGYNYRMNDISAALGLSQLNKIDKFIRRRRDIADKYNNELTGLPVELPTESPDCRSSFHLYVVRLKLDQLSISRLEIFSRLRRSGLGVNVHYIPVHTQPYFQREFGFRYGDFPNSERYYEQAISLPIFPKLTPAEQDYAIKSFITAVKV